MSTLRRPRSAQKPPGLFAVAQERMRTRHLALRTEQAYLQWMRPSVPFHGRRHPRELGAAPPVERFLAYLGLQRKVSAATQNQALQALLFLYCHVLQIELPWLDNITRATMAKRLPVVLSHEEVRVLSRGAGGVRRPLDHSPADAPAPSTAADAV